MRWRWRSSRTRMSLTSCRQATPTFRGQARYYTRPPHPAVAAGIRCMRSRCWQTQRSLLLLPAQDGGRLRLTCGTGKIATQSTAARRTGFTSSVAAPRTWSTLAAQASPTTMLSPRIITRPPGSPRATKPLSTMPYASAHPRILRRRAASRVS